MQAARGQRGAAARSGASYREMGASASSRSWSGSRPTAAVRLAGHLVLSVCRRVGRASTKLLETRGSAATSAAGELAKSWRSPRGRHRLHRRRPLRRRGAASMRPGMTLLVIEATASPPSARTAPSPSRAGAEVVDARGKTLIPGLWDMHQHFGDSTASSTSPPASPPCATSPTTPTPAGAKETGTAARRSARVCMHRRLHRRPRSLRRAHQGAVVDTEEAIAGGRQVRRSSATSVSRSTARSTPSWCR